jgi:quercetin dioxygenase-like cupin family protein
LTNNPAIENESVTLFFVQSMMLKNDSMNISSFSFETLDWSGVPKEEHRGESGMAFWRTKMVNTIRVRRVEYSPGYKADHWCSKGHILFCLEGAMSTELEDGRVMRLTKGMSYFVGDNNEPHRSSTETGCQLFIVD